MNRPTIPAGPSGILTGPRGRDLTMAEVDAVRELWTTADGQLAVLNAGWRFRQRLPDGTFEPEVRDFPDEWYEPHAVLSEPLRADDGWRPWVVVSTGWLAALTLAVIAVLVR